MAAACGGCAERTSALRVIYKTKKKKVAPVPTVFFSICEEINESPDPARGRANWHCLVGDLTAIRWRFLWKVEHRGFLAKGKNLAPAVRKLRLAIGPKRNTRFAGWRTAPTLFSAGAHPHVKNAPVRFYVVAIFFDNTPGKAAQCAAAYWMLSAPSGLNATPVPCSSTHPFRGEGFSTAGRQNRAPGSAHPQA